MRQLPFVLPELDAKLPGYALDVGKWARKEMPGVGVRRPGPGVLRQRVTLIERRIDGDRQEHEILRETILETPLQLVEVAGEPKTVCGIRTADVGERQRDDFSRQLRK